MILRIMTIFMWVNIFFRSTDLQGLAPKTSFDSNIFSNFSGTCINRQGDTVSLESTRGDKLLGSTSLNSDTLCQLLSDELPLGTDYLEDDLGSDTGGYLGIDLEGSPPPAKKMRLSKGLWLTQNSQDGGLKTSARREYSGADIGFDIGGDVEDSGENPPPAKKNKLLPERLVLIQKLKKPQSSPSRPSAMMDHSGGHLVQTKSFPKVMKKPYGSHPVYQILLYNQHLGSGLIKLNTGYSLRSENGFLIDQYKFYFDNIVKKSQPNLLGRFVNKEVVECLMSQGKALNIESLASMQENFRLKECLSEDQSHPQKTEEQILEKNPLLANSFSDRGISVDPRAYPQFYIIELTFQKELGRVVEHLGYGEFVIYKSLMASIVCTVPGCFFQYFLPSPLTKMDGNELQVFLSSFREGHLKQHNKHVRYLQYGRENPLSKRKRDSFNLALSIGESPQKSTKKRVFNKRNLPLEEIPTMFRMKKRCASLEEEEYLKLYNKDRSLKKLVTSWGNKIDDVFEEATSKESQIFDFNVVGHNQVKVALPRGIILQFRLEEPTKMQKICLQCFQDLSDMGVFSILYHFQIHHRIKYRCKSSGCSSSSDSQEFFEDTQLWEIWTHTMQHMCVGELISEVERNPSKLVDFYKNVVVTFEEREEWGDFSLGNQVVGYLVKLWKEQIKSILNREFLSYKTFLERKTPQCILISC